MSLSTELKRTFDSLETKAIPWRSRWQDIARYIQPRRYHDLTSSPMGNTLPDNTIHADLFDSTGVESNLTMAQGCLAWLTPRETKWFAFSTPSGVEATEDVDNWLGKCTEIARDYLTKSNFYTAIFEIYLDRSAFATACLSKFWQDLDDRFQFRSEPTFVCAEGDDDTVDTVFIRRCYSHRQAVGIFGAVYLPKDVQDAAADPVRQFDTDFYIHGVRPNPDYNPASPLWKHMPYLSTWFHHATGHTVSEGGGEENCYLVTRFLTASSNNPMEPYGWGPAYVALPVLKQLNKLERSQDALVDIMLNPRVLVPTNLVGKVDFRPGGRTVMPEGEQQPKEWLTQARGDYGAERAEEKRKQVRKAFMVDLFEMFAALDQSNMTATEVQARLGEKLDRASPTFDLFSGEILAPLGAWMFRVLFEAGKFPAEVPAALKRQGADGEFLAMPNVTFSNRMALAIQATQDHAALQSLGAVMPLAQADPEVLDRFDIPQIAVDYFKGSGAKFDRVRSKADVQRIKTQRAMTQAAMLQAQADQGQPPA